jgi:hypothetical protein
MLARDRYRHRSGHGVDLDAGHGLLPPSRGVKLGGCHAVIQIPIGNLSSRRQARHGV